MDVQQIVDQVMDAVKDAPEKLGELLEEPKAAIEGIIGEGKLGDIDVNEVVDGIKAKLGEIDLAGMGEDAMKAVQDFVGDATAEGGIVDQVEDFVGGLFNKDKK